MAVVWPTPIVGIPSGTRVVIEVSPVVGMLAQATTGGLSAHALLPSVKEAFVFDQGITQFRSLYKSAKTPEFPPQQAL
jgi:hypothetical protein